ncbi:MAG: hypothetical protein AB4041_11090 [Microcystaceae cyanobacterium]
MNYQFVATIVVLLLIGVALIPLLLKVYLRFSRQRFEKVVKAIGENPDLSNRIDDYIEKSLPELLEKSELGQSQRQYLSRLLLKTIPNWEIQGLKDSLTREFLESEDCKRLEDDFKIGREKLGQIKRSRQLFVYDLKILGSDNQGHYCMKPTFEQGDAYILIQIIPDQDGWLINKFKIVYKFWDKISLGIFRPWNHF